MEHVRAGNDESHHRHQQHRHHRHRITVRILRHLINFYSAIGIPLHEIPPHFDWRTISHLAFDVIKNITITAILWYYIFEKDIYRTKLLITMMDLYKPFYSTVLEITFVGLSRATKICNTVYYFAFGHRIVRELNCEPFRAAFRSAADRRQTIRLASLISIAVFAGFVGTHYNHLRIFLFKNTDTGELAAQIPILYVLWMHTNFTANVALYQQYATGCALTRIERELRKRQAESRVSGKRLGKTEFRLYLERLRAIVRVNVRINRLLTFPLITFVAVYMSNVVNTTCIFLLIYAFTGSKYFAFFGYPIMMVSYLITIATCNGENCLKFTRICEYLQMVCDKSFDLPGNNETVIKIATVTVNVRHKLRRISDELSISDLLTIREMSLYVERLRIRLFYLIIVDRRFVMHSFLAAIGFVVFIVQTNNNSFD